MAIPKLPMSVIIICIIFALIGGLWGAHAAGLLNLTPILADLPVIGSHFKVDDEGTDMEISPLEEENNILKATIHELETQLANFEVTQSTNQEEIANYKNQISQLESKIETLENKKENTTKMVELYSQMKPKEIAPILENLDDEKVAEILVSLNADHAAKILAEFDPLRAAKLSNLLTDN